MKIIQAVGWYYPDSVGGTEVYVAALSRRLRDAGHDVVVAAPDPRHLGERSYEHEGIPVYRYPIPAHPTRAEAQGSVGVRGTERFHGWMHAQRPDVVHVHTFVTGLGLPELHAAKAAGARVIVTTHSSSLGYLCQRGTMMRWGTHLCDGVCAGFKCAACVGQQRGLPQPLASAVAALPLSVARVAARIPGRAGTALGMRQLIAHNQQRQRQVLSAADRFVVLTRWALDAVAANGAPLDRLALNRLGMSHTAVTRKPPPDQQPSQPPVRIGYVGRYDPIKGVFDLARAIASLPPEVPVCVEFRGPLNDEADRGRADDVRRLVAGDRRVEFAASVDAREVPSVLARLDLLCCPAVCVEGGPTVAIESHAVGTPVIGTRIGGLAELVTDGVNGRLVPPGDWRALAGVLREVAADPSATVDHWRRHLPAARTMDAVAADYLALYAA
jgi:glycosyltransferase involved in cell wall biosynthesis